MREAAEYTPTVAGRARRAVASASRPTSSAALVLQAAHPLGLGVGAQHRVVGAREHARLRATGPAGGGEVIGGVLERAHLLERDGLVARPARQHEQGFRLAIARHDRREHHAAVVHPLAQGAQLGASHLEGVEHLDPQRRLGLGAGEEQDGLGQLPSRSRA